MKLMTLLFFSFQLFAAPLIVESVDGNKAVIYIPPNEEIKPGDTLTKPTDGNEIRSTDGQGTFSRDHKVNVRYLNSSSTARLNGVEISSSDSTETILGYTYTFAAYPNIAVGAGYGKDSKKSGGAEATSNATELYLRGNLIKNVPGSEMVPYASIGRVFADTTSSSSTSYIKGSGIADIFSLGIEMFPLKEIVSLAFAYTQSNMNMRYTGQDTAVFIKTSGFSLEVGLYF